MFFWGASRAAEGHGFGHTMKSHLHNSALACGCLLLLLAWPASGGTAVAAEGPGPAARPPLVVVSDDNYPPYIFREASGQLRGILPDQWALWERKTGIPVSLLATNWARAQFLMREGQADVIDTIFYNEDRAKLLAFTPPYAQIEVPVYAHKTLGGISDIASLKGFTIGVKAGDNAVDYLKHRGIDSLKEYTSFEAIIVAAKNQEIKVFAIDQPAAVYYLYKYGVAGDFRQSFLLNRGALHRAVQKDQPELLKLVQDGFDKISPGEYRAIDRKWMGTPFMSSGFMRQGLPWILGVLAAILALAAGNILLVRRVHTKTSELRKALEELRQSLAAQQRTEESLRNSREYFATVFDSINDGLFIHDTESFKVLDVNQSMLKMYGFSTREAALAALAEESDDPPPYSSQDVIAWLRKARDEGPQVFEWHARRHGGQRFWVEVSIRKVRIGANDRLIVTVRDMSAHKAAQETLRESNELFSLFMQHSPIYVFIKEVSPAGSRVLMASENFSDMVGVPGSRMQGMTMEELFPPEFAAKITEDDRAVVAKGAVLKLDENLNDRHYTTIKFPIVRNGKTLLAGYTIDITERKRAEQALALALEHYDLLAKQNRIVTWEIDIRGLYTQLGNEAGLITKRPVEDLVGKKYFYELHPQEGRKAFKDRVLEYIRRGEPLRNLVHPVQTGEGDVIWISSSGIPVYDKEGSIQGYWGTSTDITDRVRSEEEKTALLEKLMHAQKLESVGRLAGGVAHDFNNMLQAILSYTEMALEQVPPGQPLRADLLEIQKAAQRSAKLTGQLQTFARKQAVAPVALDINEAVTHLSDMVRRLIGKDIHLAWTPGLDVGSVMIDPGQFDQLVVNLCINARDAIAGAGSIGIETARVELTPAISSHFDGITPGSYVLLTFRDDGAGMQPEIVDRIFEPFFTTKHPGKGTGLGLSIVYGIVKQNGGHIRVTSNPGRGSVFELYLPASDGTRAEPEPRADGGASTTAPCGTILLVDDEESILRPTRLALEKQGYRVFATTSPLSAIQLYDEKAGQIDLLITDVVMPDMSGPDMVKQLLKRQPDLRHLFISGHTGNLLAGEELNELSANCLQKPFSREALCEKVREALADG